MNADARPDPHSLGRRPSAPPRRRGRAAGRSSGLEAGGRGVKWPRGGRPVPSASSRRHADGPADAGDERCRGHDRDSRGVSFGTNHRADDVRGRCAGVARARRPALGPTCSRASCGRNCRTTIRLVHAGHKRIVPEVATELAEHAADDALSPREIEVLRLIAGGNANKMIAAQLSITEETVKGHVKNILAKLAANDRTHAVTIGLKRGIIDLCSGNPSKGGRLSRTFGAGARVPKAVALAAGPLCKDYSRHSRAVCPEPAWCSCARQRRFRWFMRGC